MIVQLILLVNRAVDTVDMVVSTAFSVVLVNMCKQWVQIFSNQGQEPTSTWQGCTLAFATFALLATCMLGCCAIIFWVSLSTSMFGLKVLPTFVLFCFDCYVVINNVYFLVDCFCPFEMLTIDRKTYLTKLMFCPIGAIFSIFLQSPIVIFFFSGQSFLFQRWLEIFD